MDKKGIITIAVGKKYVSQAKYLAHSCMLHTPHTLRAVITDDPAALAAYYDIAIPYNPEYGDPFAAKTRLHWYTPFEKNLYIDADSLVIHNIDSFWEYLEENAFVYNGEMLVDGDWYFNIAQTIVKTGILWLPKFNSGMFLFRNNEKSKNVFDTAYDYLINQKEKGFSIDFFRRKMLPDEPFLAIALAKNNIKPVNDYGRFSRTLIGAERIRINSVKGVSFFIKNGTPVYPLIVHFCGRFGAFIYLLEKIKLFFHFNPPFAILFTNIFSFIRKIVKNKEK
jgi:hypothetical protein